MFYVLVRSDNVSRRQTIMPDKNPVIALAKFIVYSAVAFFIPEQGWPPVARGLARLSSLLRRVFRRGEVSLIETILGRPLTETEAREIEIDKSANAFLTAFLTVGQRFQKGRPANIRTHGLENITAAREAGNGVILWVCPFSFARIIAKIGLHRTGIEVSHLSRESHGFGHSRIAVRYLNRHWTDGENLYLKDRLVMTADNEIGALRALRRCLQDSGVVSITLGREGKSRGSVPFLNGSMTVATGTLGLAVSTGAAVLPVYALRDKEGGFDVTVDRPLAAGSAGERDAQFDHMLKDLADRLAPVVAQHPGQWANWDIFHSSE